MTDVAAYQQDPEFVLLGDDGEPLEAPGLTDDDALTFLAESATGEHNVPLTAAAEVHTGAMIALIPTVDDAERLAVDLGEPVDQLHITLMYLGNAADWSTDQRLAVEDAVRPFARELSPVDAEGFAISVFNPPGSERNDGVQRDACLVLQLSGSSLAVVHSVVTALVQDVNHVAAGDPRVPTLPEIPRQHSPWIPHMTLEYTDDVSKVAELTDRVGPVRFDVLRFAFGGENVDIPLVGALVASAAVEFVNGDTVDSTPNREVAVTEVTLGVDPDDAFALEAADLVVIAGPSRIPPHLRAYWLGPEGSTRVGGWGNKGSWTRCTEELRKEGVPGYEVKGECTNLYHEATGRYPGSKKEHSVETVTAATATDLSAGAGPDELVNGTRVTNPTWSGILTIEGGESGDGRMFSLGSLDFAQLPQPLMYQPTNAGGHKDSVLVGQITHMRRKGNAIHGRGDIDMASEYGPEAHRLMKEHRLNGVSVDVDTVKDADVEFVYEDAVEAADGAFPAPNPFAKPSTTIFHRGRIRGATLVNFPAFVEATLTLDDCAECDGLEPVNASAGDEGEVSQEFSSASINDLPDEVFGYIEPGGTKDASGKTVPRSLRHFPLQDADHVRNALARANQSPFGAKAMPKILAAAKKFGVTVSNPQAALDLIVADVEPLTAASHIIEIPDLPPAEWFNEPTDVQLHGAFTVTDEGRVYGLLAPAKTTHRVKPRTVPLGVSYKRFMKGETLVADGGRVVTGPITMNCGHAPTQNYGTYQRRIEHYDNSCSVVADVTIGERADGSVWFGGALKHGVTPEQVSTIMSCALSGDWQPNPDRPDETELIAALLVPVPGFPLARAQASVSFEDGLLTASAVPVRAATATDRVTVNTGLLATDWFRVLVASTKETLAESIGRSRQARVAELRSSLRE